MNCPSCGAPMRVAGGGATLRCDYCGSVVIAKTDELGLSYLEEAQDLACPACAVPLWGATLAGMQIHACKRCHGLLVAMGGFESLIERMRAEQSGSEIPAAQDAPDLNRKTDCPRCRQRMDTHFYYGGGNAVISGCEQCSLNWLDGGVLLRIVRAAHTSDAEAGV